MFQKLFTKQEETHSGAATCVIQKRPFQAEMPDADYVALSEQLGINEIPLQMAELERVLEAEAVAIYDYDTVVAYLTEQVREANKEVPYVVHLEWRPVKKYGRYGSFEGTFDRSLSVGTTIYNKPIPPAVCLTIERISEKCPKAIFLVSDIVSYPDPFLAVTIDGGAKVFVVERWDEPSFRDKR